MTSVLCSRLSAMGDLVHCLGAIAALHRTQPETRITLVTQSEYVDLVADHPGIARVVGFDRRGGVAAWWRLRAALREDDYDVGLDLQSNWKSAFSLRLSGARERVGVAARWRREPASRVLLHRTIEVPGTDHPAVVAHTLVREVAPAAPFVVAELDVAADEIAQAAAAVRERGIDPSQPFRVIVVTDPRDPRALRPAVIAGETRSSPMPVLHLFGPDEREVAAGPVPALRHGDGTPRQLVALGRLVASVGGDVLGPDQGATHVLSAAGARCTVWFGSQDPARTAPVGATALVHPSPPSCSPCRERRCTHADGPVCMEFAAAEARAVPFSGRRA